MIRRQRGLCARNLTAEEPAVALLGGDRIELGGSARATADPFSAQLAVIVVFVLLTVLTCGGWVIVFVLLHFNFAAGPAHQPAMLKFRAEGPMRG